MWVFVSSTHDELAEERRAAVRAVSAPRLTPVIFEAGHGRTLPATARREPLTAHSAEQAHSVAVASARRCSASRWCTAATGTRTSRRRRHSDASR